ncbi:hypothetical protein SPRG_00368 [Saprolegnia parasitica CBS 223.65]|uniref:Uncharacterized protein n=1 Tax=Saprolegnia parasitica (strain CBS 223.65) TaxID=695850 RepID=A0A067DA47_SAPPC|nr:hypothetical protein SPRG_00368 [Saprolegnia parasitica CBS 223.65]KDO35521.1 hypothetical protein SPRG_00368 [Saprolegnia parasitica CBS 223.65]|eukprot:XP_012193857.1 hypothetical protein SPRG_00368 [Saprolegnia parasitica CBS 223.65]
MSVATYNSAYPVHFSTSTISPKNATSTPMMMRHPSSSSSTSSANAVRAGFRGKCRYKSGRCPNERTLKFNGEVHTMCEEHRIRHNNNQRKSDMKRRVKKHPEPATQSFVMQKREVQKALPGLHSPKTPTSQCEVRLATTPERFSPMHVPCTDFELETSRTTSTEVVLSMEELEILHSILGLHDEELAL